MDAPNLICSVLAFSRRLNRRSMYGCFPSYGVILASCDGNVRLYTPLECDEDEAVFDEKLKRIAQAKVTLKRIAKPKPPAEKS